MPHKLTTRSAPREDRGLTTRAAAATAASFDPAARTVRAVAATEAPVQVWDWDRYEVVREVLLMDGAVLPDNGQVPLLDAHNRFTVAAVLGSARDFSRGTADGLASLEAVVSFADTVGGTDAMVKIRDRHLTDFSVGYAAVESFWIPEGEKQVIAGRTFEGPLRVTTKWRLFELSTTPVGADPLAKTRTAGGRIRMNKKLKKLLMARGLAPEASDADALAFLRGLAQADQDTLHAEAGLAQADPEPAAARSEPATPAAPASAPAAARSADPAPAPTSATPGTAPEVQRMIDQAIARARADDLEIREMVRVAGLGDEVADEMVRTMTPPDEARRQIFQRMAAANPPLAGTRAEVLRTESEKFRAAALDGLCLRCGVRVERPADGHENFRGIRLMRLAEECLTRAGASTRGLTDTELVRRALAQRSGIIGSSSSDFPALMSNLANRVLLAQYTEAASTWEAWCRVTEVVDFKEVYGIRLSAGSDLDLIGEDGEYKYGKLSEEQESYHIGTYGKMFTLSRKMIINDDLRAFVRIPALFGAAARRKESDIVYSLLLSNPAMADNTAVFHATKGNLATGQAVGGITNDTLSAARKAMRLATGQADEVINIEARYLLIPAALETQAEIILRSVTLPPDYQHDYSPGIVNPWSSKLQPIVEARLDAVSSKAWYLAADSSQVDTIEVAFLVGNRQPYLEEQEGFEVDGIKMKIRHDFGAGIMDRRGLYKNPGE